MIQRSNYKDGSSGFYYDVGVSVGAGGYNYQEDTMLVQYFMHWIAIKGSIKGDLDPSEVGALALKVDGIVGPKTLTAIYVYQGVNGLTLDGRVDPSQVTILWLNDDFQSAWPYVDPAMPAAWPAAPPLLAAALARVASSAATT
jgi:peptidoglycan hydrolase-like protein with peptidoglycan-binding domain